MDRQKNGVDATYRIHGKPARYTVGGQRGVDLRIIPTQPDDDIKFGASRASIETLTFMVRVSEVVRPRSGDLLEFEGETYSIVAGAERDAQRYSWLVTGQIECG